MKKLVVLCALGLTTLLLVVSVAWCQQQPQPSTSPPDSTPLVTPKPTPAPSEEDWITKPEYFAPSADTIVIGQVTEGLPPIEKDNSIYRDWVFEVESYVVNPLPDVSLKVGYRISSYMSYID